MPEFGLYQVSVKVFLRNAKGEVLILRIPDHWPTAGFYDVPGGRIDVGEHDLPFLDILRRELREELNINDAVIHPHPVGLASRMVEARVTKTAQDMPILYLFFEAQTAQEKIEMLDEYSGIEWKRANDLTLDMFPSGFRDGVAMYLDWLKEKS